MDTLPTDELKRGYRLSVMIGIAMIFSLFIYAAMVEILKARFESFRETTVLADIELLRYLLLGISILIFFIIRWIRAFILSQKGTTGAPSDSRASLSRAVSKLVSATVVTYALCESVAIFGFVLFFLGWSSIDFYLFWILSLLFFAIYFPRYRQWEDWIQGLNLKGG